MNFFEYLSKRSPVFFLISGSLLALLIGIPDYLLRSDLSFSIFYLIPVAFTVWYAGKTAGVFMACISAGVWFAADTASGAPYAHGYLNIWNAIVRLGFFLITVFLLDGLKREKASAREDYLTGLGNRRYFFESADAEIKRSRRYGHPFTLGYIDVDNFKYVNDRFGHDEGDALLRSIAEIIRSTVRSTDIEARLGGDEFALLLPETDAESSIKFFNKLHRKLSDAEKRTKRKATFSIGVLTFHTAPDSIDEMIKIVDGVMYSAKNSGRNLVKYEVFDHKGSRDNE